MIKDIEENQEEKGLEKTVKIWTPQNEVQGEMINTGMWGVTIYGTETSAKYPTTT